MPKLDQVHILLSETWLQGNIPTNMVNVPGYVCFRKDRSSGKGGGVLIYIRETFKCIRVDLNTKILCLALKVILSPRMKFNIVVLYNPPSHTLFFMMI